VYWENVTAKKLEGEKEGAWGPGELPSVQKRKKKLVRKRGASLGGTGQRGSGRTVRPVNAVQRKDRVLENQTIEGLIVRGDSSFRRGELEGWVYGEARACCGERGTRSQTRRELTG